MHTLVSVFHAGFSVEMVSITTSFCRFQCVSWRSSLWRTPGHAPWSPLFRKIQPPSETRGIWIWTLEGWHLLEADFRGLELAILSYQKILFWALRVNLSLLYPWPDFIAIKVSWLEYCRNKRHKVEMSLNRYSVAHSEFLMAKFERTYQTSEEINPTQILR